MRKKCGTNQCSKEALKPLELMNANLNQQFINIYTNVAIDGSTRQVPTKLHLDKKLIGSTKTLQVKKKMSQPLNINVHASNCTPIQVRKSKYTQRTEDQSFMTQNRVQQSNVKTSQTKVQEVATNLFPMRGRSSISTTSNFRRKLNSVLKQRCEGDVLNESMEQSVQPRIDEFLLTQEKTKMSEKRPERSPDTRMSKNAIANILNLDQLCISTTQTPNHQQFEQGKFAISAKTHAEDARRQTVLTHQPNPNFVRRRQSKNSRPGSKGTDAPKFKKLNPKVSKDQQSNQRQSVLNDLVVKKNRVMT